ncbi:MAG: inositol monophosphatase family protein [Solirubrobacteraceae bacterium]
MSAHPDELLAIACEAATHAGALLRERFAAGTERVLTTKTTPTDLVSEADLASQQAIRELLGRRRPEDGFLGEEEEADSAGSSGLRWVVDPLDGTVNFLFGIPQWCVSVAVEDGAGMLAGAICDPLRGELWTATRGGPARLGDRVLALARTPDLAGAMVATGLAYDARVREAQGAVLARLAGRVRDVRRLGSAALDLAWCAGGRYDAYFERTVKPWDIAAGVLICRSAGLEVRDLDGAGETLPYGILAAPPGLAGELHALVG